MLGHPKLSGEGQRRHVANGAEGHLPAHLARLRRSTASRVPHGGGVHGTPSGETSTRLAIDDRACPPGARSRRGRRALAGTSPSPRGIRVVCLRRCGSGSATRSLRSGSQATLPQLKPPGGTRVLHVPCRLGGVKMPSLRSASMLPRQRPRSQGVSPQASSGGQPRRVQRRGAASGRAGSASVISPGTSALGHRPLLDREERLAASRGAGRRAWPIFVACTTAGIASPVAAQIEQASAATARRSPRGRGAPSGSARPARRVAAVAARRPSSRSGRSRAGAPP